MDQPAPASTAAESANQMVTASELVRHFGVWQDRAVRAPVYVVHRGRPRLVLTSVDLMEALCAPHAAGESGPLPVGALLRGAREAAVAVDRELRVTVVGNAARGLLGREVQPGVPLASAWPSPNDFVAAAAARVVASGTAEVLEVAGARAGDRRLSVAVEPLDRGAVLFARDVTAEDRARDLAADLASHAAALIASGTAAVAGVTLRGYLEPPAPSLAALAGLSPDALGGTRLVSLIEVGSRVAVGDALETALSDGVPATADAALLVNRGAPLPVRVALAPRRRGAAVDGVTALLVARRAS